MNTQRRSLEERFWEKVDKNGPKQPHMSTNCWLWTGATSKAGYGSIGSGGRRGVTKYAHVVAFELQHGPLPEDKMVLHHCDVKLCVRHVYAGTHADNMRDRQVRGRTASGNRAGVRMKPHAFPRGSQKHNAKLTEKAVLSMRAAGAAGESQESLARRFGVSSGYVCRILHREVWKHI